MALVSVISAGPRKLWMGLLVLLSVLFSLGFSCAVPLAAFAAIGALTLSRRDAFVLIGAVWLANQIIGFAFLHYPLEPVTFAWGGALGAVAVLATFAAQSVNGRRPQQTRIVAASAAFLAAFAAYEGALFALSAAAGSGLSSFAPAIAGRIFLINAAAFAALIVAYRLGSVVSFAVESRLSARERRA
ncbi:MAG: hypothetical protein L0Y57_14840 [Beijerinckiaceae bacterium]|nr:hypothetical protein [Beijerinckiaceae bacterium]MCI0598404.1 hypothetical protein [Beijerinckiaceae bacterium]MCI0736857.1 hypothetical protein [Beijerinckiaceae bacterium]